MLLRLDLYVQQTRLSGGFVKRPSLTQAAQISVTKNIAMTVAYSVTPKATANNTLLFCKLA